MKSIKKVIIKDEKYEDGYSELLARISEKGDLEMKSKNGWISLAYHQSFRPINITNTEKYLEL